MEGKGREVGCGRGRLEVCEGAVRGRGAEGSSSMLKGSLMIGMAGLLPSIWIVMLGISGSSGSTMEGMLESSGVTMVGIDGDGSSATGLLDQGTGGEGSSKIGVLTVGISNASLTPGRRMRGTGARAGGVGDASDLVGDEVYVLYLPLRAMSDGPVFPIASEFGNVSCLASSSSISFGFHPFWKLTIGRPGLSLTAVGWMRAGLLSLRRIVVATLMSSPLISTPSFTRGLSSISASTSSCVLSFGGVGGTGSFVRYQAFLD